MGCDDIFDQWCCEFRRRKPRRRSVPQNCETIVKVTTTKGIDTRELVREIMIQGANADPCKVGNRVRRKACPSIIAWTTDRRTGTVDKDQRRGSIFRAATDGRVWDTDLHAAEMIGRYLFLRPKSDRIAAALAA